MSTFPTAPQSTTARPELTRDRTRALLGQVMGLVALTVACAALGAYLGRDWSNGIGLLCFLAAFGCIFGLNIASAKGNYQLAVGLLFGLGLLLGAAIAPTIVYYLDANPAAVWQAAGTTALFVAATGSYGYATRRDLSFMARGLFFALLALIVFGIVAIFVRIPQSDLIWSIAGLVIFGGYTIYDFNRLRRTSPDAAVPIAASIFLDIFNIFLFLLNIFGRR